MSDYDSNNRRIIILNSDGDVVSVRNKSDITDASGNVDLGNIGKKTHLLLIVDNLSKQEADRMKSERGSEEKYPYRVPLDLIKSSFYGGLDIGRVKEFIDYQPMKDIIIDASERVSLVYDKRKASFKYSMKRII